MNLKYTKINNQTNKQKNKQRKKKITKMSFYENNRISLNGIADTWEDGSRIPSWCFAPGVTFRIQEVKRQPNGMLRVVVGDHTGTPGKITYGTTGAFLVYA